MSSNDPSSDTSHTAEPKAFEATAPEATSGDADVSATAAAPAAEPPAAPPAPEPASTQAEEGAAPDAPSNAATDDATDDASDESDDAADGDAADGDGADGDATDGTEPTGDAEAPAGADAADATAADPNAPPKKRRRRRKKKPRTGAEPGERPRQGERSRKSERQRHRASDRAPFHVGEEVFGKVTAVLDSAIMVDLSGKALAILDRSEMEADDLVPAPGDKFVARVHNDGARGGLVVLTRKPLREEETKPHLEQAHREGTPVQGLITGAIKGGVEVDVGGVRAFAPASGMDLHPANANFTALVGQRLDFKVSQYEKAGRDVVVTRRPMLEAEAHERRKHALSLLKAEQVTPGVVRTVVEWGVFVALPEAENVEGLVHASEATHEHSDLFELFKPGDRFDVKILEIDERGKIWLSRKALIEDPWGAARKQYGQGTRHTGKVVRLERFGAFVELAPGIDGFLHVTDLSFERIEHAKDVLKEGQDLEVVVQYFDFRSKKIGLHLAPTGERANEAPQRIAKNALVKVEVVKGESAGLIVRLLGVTGRAGRGFVPAGQTGTPRGTDLRKAFKPGSILETKVIDVDPRSGEPKLSIRGFKEDEERRAHREYREKLKAEGGFGTLGDLLRQKLAPAAPPPAQDASSPTETDEPTP